MADNTVYIVSGFPRSGTSMMMESLEAGGLTAAYSERKHQQVNDRWGDESYRPQPGEGIYELEAADYQTHDFPLAYKGRLIKALFGAMLGLRGDLGLDYKIVFMKRDPEEIRQSYLAFFSQDLGSARVPLAQRLREYDATVARITGILEQRRDVNLTVLDYETVVEAPQVAFEALRGAGWGIDPVAASQVPTGDRRRFRLEELEVGVR